MFTSNLYAARHHAPSQKPTAGTVPAATGTRDPSEGGCENPVPGLWFHENLSPTRNPGSGSSQHFFSLEMENEIKFWRHFGLRIRAGRQASPLRTAFETGAGL